MGAGKSLACHFPAPIFLPAPLQLTPGSFANVADREKTNLLSCSLTTRGNGQTKMTRIWQENGGRKISCLSFSCPHLPASSSTTHPGVFANVADREKTNSLSCSLTTRGNGQTKMTRIWQENGGRKISCLSFSCPHLPANSFLCGDDPFSHRNTDVSGFVCSLA